MREAYEPPSAMPVLRASRLLTVQMRLPAREGGVWSMSDTPKRDPVDDTPVAPEPPFDTALSMQTPVAIRRNSFREGWAAGWRAAQWPYAADKIAVICDLRVARNEASVSVVAAFVDGAEAMAEATKLANSNVMPNRVFTVHSVKLKGKAE